MTRGLYPPDSLSQDDIRAMHDLRKGMYETAAVGLGEFVRFEIRGGGRRRVAATEARETARVRLRTQAHLDFDIPCAIPCLTRPSSLVPLPSLPFAVAGTASGFVLHTGLRRLEGAGLVRRGMTNPNTAILAVLGCGALGMFVGATKAGKEGVHNLHPIYGRGATPRDGGSGSGASADYRSTVWQARRDKKELELEEQQQQAPARSEDDDRWYRQAPSEGFFHDDGRSAAEVDVDQLKRNQILRRSSVRERIRHGHGIGDIPRGGR